MLGRATSVENTDVEISDLTSKVYILRPHVLSTRCSLVVGRDFTDKGIRGSHRDLLSRSVSSNTMTTGKQASLTGWAVSFICGLCLGVHVGWHLGARGFVLLLYRDLALSHVACILSTTCHHLPTVWQTNQEDQSMVVYSQVLYKDLTLEALCTLADFAQYLPHLASRNILTWIGVLHN